MKKKYLFIFLIVLQLAAIVFLGKRIQRDKTINTLGVSINISGEGEAFVKKTLNSKLNHFYEPIANRTVDVKLPWEPSKIISTIINSDTLNNPERDHLRINVSTVVAIGDSFTYGEYVESKNSWVRLLENEIKSIKDVDVINLGVPGYDIEYSIERFRIRGPKYNPKLVIWFLKDDDFISIADVLQPIIEEEQKIFERGEMREQSELSIPKAGHSDPVFIERALARFLSALGGVENINKYQDEKMHILREYYYGNIIIMHLPLKKEYEAILKNWAARDSKVLLLELPDLDKESVFPDGHPNESGHSLIKNTLFQFIMKKRLLSI